MFKGLFGLIWLLILTSCMFLYYSPTLVNIIADLKTQISARCALEGQGCEFISPAREAQGAVEGIQKQVLVLLNSILPNADLSFNYEPRPIAFIFFSFSVIANSVLSRRSKSYALKEKSIVRGTIFWVSVNAVVLSVSHFLGIELLPYLFAIPLVVYLLPNFAIAIAKDTAIFTSGALGCLFRFLIGIPVMLLALALSFLRRVFVEILQAPYRLYLLITAPFRRIFLAINRLGDKIINKIAEVIDRLDRD
jgi:hypothetical protein